MGDAVAGLALDALAGKPIVDVEMPHTFFADARQLKRWGLSEDALPPETALSIQQPNIWEEYWPQISAVFAVLALQAIVITGLLVERRCRFAAESESRFAPA